jgi:hypothetical protein
VEVPCKVAAHSSIIGGAFLGTAAFFAIALAAGAAASCGGSGGAGLDILGAMAANRTAGTLGQPVGQWFSATNSGCNISTAFLKESLPADLKLLCAMPQLVSATTSPKGGPFSGLQSQKAF